MFIKEMFKTLYDIKYYNILSKKSTKSSVYYSLAITLLCAFILSLLIGIELKLYVLNPMNHYFQNIPQFQLSSYGFTIESNTPFVYESADTIVEANDDLVLLDLASKYKGSLHKNKVFIAYDGYLVARNNEILSTDFYSKVSELKGITLTKDDFSFIVKNINDKVFIILAAFFILSILFSFAATLLRSFIYSVFLIIISEMKKKKISFKTSYTVSLYATTFYIIAWIPTILIPMPISFIMKIIILHLISLCYLYFISNNIGYEQEV